MTVQSQLQVTPQSNSPSIGILALQGAFIEHKQMLDELGASSFEIRQRADFEQEMDGLIIPGGESTTMSKLLVDLHLFEPVAATLKDGLPVFGTCAGMILLAKHVAGGQQRQFGVIDATVRRNAYGRQLGSFQATCDFKGIGDVPATFIRAPYVEQASDQVEILAQLDGHIVAVRQGKALATAFHPELSVSTKIHEYFLAMV